MKASAKNAVRQIVRIRLEKVGFNYDRLSEEEKKYIGQFDFDQIVSWIKKWKHVKDVAKRNEKNHF